MASKHLMSVLGKSERNLLFESPLRTWEGRKKNAQNPRMSRSVLADRAARSNGFSSSTLAEAHWLSSPPARHPSHCFRFVLLLTLGEHSAPKAASIQSHREPCRPLAPSRGMLPFSKIFWVPISLYSMPSS